LKTFCENLKDINSVNKAFNSGNVSYKAGQNEHTADVWMIIYSFYLLIFIKLFLSLFYFYKNRKIFIRSFCQQ
jgi:hypothetical protein